MNKKRRMLLKTFSIAAVSAGIVGMIHEKNEKSSNLNDDSKQLNNKALIRTVEGCNYSVAMPFDFKVLEQLANFSKNLTKSKVTTLYNSYPTNIAKDISPYFSHMRGSSKDVQSVDDFYKCVENAKKLGFDFVYTLNSPLIIQKEDLGTVKKEVDKIVNRLKTLGCNKFKVANEQMINMLSNRGLEIQLSTSTEYSSLQSYKMMLEKYPDIKQINLRTNENHNFKLIKNLKKQFPDVEIEILVNEISCVKNCPVKNSHQVTNYVNNYCGDCIRKDPYLFFCRTNLVHPWELQNFIDIGVKDFKLTTHKETRGSIKNLKYLMGYITAAEYGIHGYNVRSLFENIYFEGRFAFDSKLKLEKIIEKLPNFNYVASRGHLCASECGVECDYCEKCAKEVKKNTKLLI